MSRNAYTTGLVGLIAAGSLFFLLYGLFSGAVVGSTIYVTAVSTIVFVGLLLVQIRGWRYTPEMLVSIMVITTILGASPAYLQTNVYISALLPSVVAAAILPTVWALGTFVITLVGSLLSVAFQRGFTAEALGPTVRFENMLILIMIAIGIFAASSLAWSLQRQATESARRAQEERDQVELTSRELAEANHQMNVQIDQQRQLLDLVATLETPAVQLADGVLFTPIVGHVDTRRAQNLTARLLRDVNTQRARLVILDISGVAVMDTGVAQALLNTAKALRLLGCDVTLSGISASVALTLTDLGINLTEVKTVRSPQEAMQLFAGNVATSNGKSLLV